MNKKVVLFLNGEKPNQLADLSTYNQVFCTDGAYYYLTELNVIPDVISGDFDSITCDSINPEIKIIHTPDQNYTDFEKALKIILDFGYKEVDIFGASGKQQDHFLGNLNAAYKFKNQLKLVFYDNYSTYQFIPKHFKIDSVLNQTISLLPFPTAKGITTKGLKYSLNNEDLDLLHRIGTRNKAILDEIELSYTEGELVLFVLK